MKRRPLYYLSTILLFFYFIFSAWELMVLLQDKKRLVQIPLVILVFFISTILPYWIVRYTPSSKKSALKNITFGAQMIILFWLLLVLVFFGLRVLNFCSGFSCWYPLIPVIWFAPIFILSLIALFTLKNKR
ncbi:MAG TPA: hypothetical protein VLE91_04795 [Candidatus Saccharimonadales bacterium]|nr:hypothetical protein [Candidatus Saccharimonadales bacterium]